MTQNLTFTGERYIPDVKGEIRLEHMHRYALAQKLCSGKNVLDIACGEGYGSHMLAECANSVVGVDISQEAVDHAMQKYSAKENLTFKTGSASKIDFADHSFDLVVSFETIEHLLEQSEMIAEIRRVLKPDGALLISSPNRPIYSEESNQHNEYHVKELDLKEFDQLLREKFEFISYFGQRLFISSLVQYFESGEKVYQALYDDGEVVQEQLGPIQESKYFIAYCTSVASNQAPFRSSILQTHGFDLLKQYISYAKWANNTDAEIQLLRSMYSELQTDHHDIATWAKAIDLELVEQKSKRIEEEQKNLDLTSQINDLALTNTELNHKILFLQSDIESLTKEKNALEENETHLMAALENANRVIHETKILLDDAKRDCDVQAQQHQNKILQIEVDHQSELNVVLSSHFKKVETLESSLKHTRDQYLKSAEDYKSTFVEMYANSQEKLQNLETVVAEERSVLLREIQKLQSELQNSILQREDEAKLNRQKELDLERQLKEQLLSSVNRIEKNQLDFLQDFILDSKKSFDRNIEFQHEIKDGFEMIRELKKLLDEEVSRSENMVHILNNMKAKKWWNLK